MRDPRHRGGPLLRAVRHRCRSRADSPGLRPDGRSRRGGVTAIATVLGGLTFLESPRWHEDRVWVSDFYSGQVLSARADGADRRLEAFVPAQPSGLGWLPDGRLLIVSMLD